MNKEYYKITTSYANYYVEIWHQYPGIDKVYIGGRKKCVGFSVYLDEGEPPMMDGFGFNPHCNIAGNHIKGIGSVHLLNVAMRFIINHYQLPEDIKFEFKDTSFIECINYNMPLYIYYIIFHGKTWYEEKFDAMPMNKNAIPRLQQAKKRLKEFLDSKPSLENFFGDHQIKLREYVMNIYDQCSTLRQCLEILKKEDCKVFKGWLVALFDEIVNCSFDQHWFIINKVPRDFVSYTKIDKPDNLFSLKGGMIFRRDELG